FGVVQHGRPVHGPCRRARADFLSGAAPAAVIVRESTLGGEEEKRKKSGRTPISEFASGCVPWYVGFSLKRTTPDCRVREWDDPHPFSRRQLPWLHLDPAKASLHAAVSTRSPSRTASCTLASRRSDPSTSASSASTAANVTPSSSSPTSTAESSSRP